MISKDELRKIGIYSWADLESEFKNSNILLGNGFSRSLADTFNYESLFAEFLSKCPSEYKNIFEMFDTNNFEKIMVKLTYAIYVNELFGKHEPKIEQAAKILQDGLIKTIGDIHPKSEAIYWNRLETIANKIRFFNDIYTLNYDLFIYHIIMILKDQSEKNEQYRNLPQYKDLWLYSDSFYGEEYEGGRFKGCKYFIKSDKYKAIYYLHGALFIFSFGEQIEEMKLIRKDRKIELIKLIGDTIREGKMPVFVCEGSSDKKLEQIKSSSYLNWVYFKKFCKTEKHKFAIFGCSLSQQDNHIINILDKSGNTLAISLHLGEKTAEQLESIKQNYENKFTKATVRFFDSETLFTQ
jgi:hypothetical protein